MPRELSAQEGLADLEFAFGQTPFPEGEALAFDSDGETLVAFYSTPDWRSLNIRGLAVYPQNVLTPIGLHYYLPAHLRHALEPDWDLADWGAELLRNIDSCMNGLRAKRSPSGRLEPWGLKRMQHFSRQQLFVLRRSYERIYAMHRAPDCDFDLRNSARLFWQWESFPEALEAAIAEAMTEAAHEG